MRWISEKSDSSYAKHVHWDQEVWITCFRFFAEYEIFEIFEFFSRLWSDWNFVFILSHGDVCVMMNLFAPVTFSRIPEAVALKRERMPPLSLQVLKNWIVSATLKDRHVFDVFLFWRCDKKLILSKIFRLETGGEAYRPKKKEELSLDYPRVLTCLNENMLIFITARGSVIKCRSWFSRNVKIWRFDIFWKFEKIASWVNDYGTVLKSFGG
jgi:hypothetical protein